MCSRMFVGVCELALAQSHLPRREFDLGIPGWETPGQ